MDIMSGILSVLFLGSEVLLMLLKRSKSAETRVRKDKQSILILWLTISVAITVAVILGQSYPKNSNVIIFQWISVAFMLIGFIVRWVSVFQLGKAFTVDVAVAHDHMIKNNGMYKYIRHPSYLGLVLLFLGLSMMMNSWIPLFVINIPIFFALKHRIQIEEDLLKESFGDAYTAYMKATWKLFPYIY